METINVRRLYAWVKRTVRDMELPDSFVKEEDAPLAKHQQAEALLAACATFNTAKRVQEELWHPADVADAFAEEIRRRHYADESMIRQFKADWMHYYTLLDAQEPLSHGEEDVLALADIAHVPAELHEIGPWLTPRKDEFVISHGLE